jgi:hypothetical protein
MDRYQILLGKKPSKSIPRLLWGVYSPEKIFQVQTSTRLPAFFYNGPHYYRLDYFRVDPKILPVEEFDEVRYSIFGNPPKNKEGWEYKPLSPFVFKWIEVGHIMLEDPPCLYRHRRNPNG